MRFLLVAALSLVACSSEPTTSEDTTESAFTSYQAQVSSTLRRGSQPDHGALVKLKADGYRTVVNLRTSDEERRDVLALGLDPHHIPVVDRTAPTRAQVDGFIDFATNPQNQPLFIHCNAGQGRTGVFVAAYRIAVQHWNVDDALNEARHYGMTDPDQIAFIHAWSEARND